MTPLCMASVWLSHVHLPCKCDALVSGLFKIPPIPSVAVTAIEEDCECLAFLKFLYLLLTWLQTGCGLTLAHRPHCECQGHI